MTRLAGSPLSRERIMARIREALRQPAPPPHLGDSSVASAAGSADDSMPSLRVLPAEVGRPWLPEGGSTPAERLAVLCDNLEKLRAEVHRCGSLEEAAERIAAISRERGWTRVAWHAGELTSPVAERLPCEGYRVDDEEGCDAAVLETCDAGITGCESLVAQTGSILVDSGSCGGRGLSVLPHVHLVIATLDQITATLGDALEQVRARHAGRLPSMLSFITGPSRTGDIERILVLGAHGPKELHLMLIDPPKKMGTGAIYCG